MRKREILIFNGAKNILRSQKAYAILDKVKAKFVALLGMEREFMITSVYFLGESEYLTAPNAANLYSVIQSTKF